MFSSAVLFYIMGVSGNRANHLLLLEADCVSGRTIRRSPSTYRGCRTRPNLLGRGFKAAGLSCGSQAQLIVGPVEDGEVLADEDVTQDPELASVGVEVHALEATNAGVIFLQSRE